MVRTGEKILDMEMEAYFAAGNAIKKLRLSDYAGKWLVLAFYPADVTFVCPTELAELAENYDAFVSKTRFISAAYAET